MTTMKDQPTRNRAEHFDLLQSALEEGLRDINAARSPEEAEKARKRARLRLEALNQDFETAFAAN